MLTEIEQRRGSSENLRTRRHESLGFLSFPFFGYVGTIDAKQVIWTSKLTDKEVRIDIDLDTPDG